MGAGASTISSIRPGLIITLDASGTLYRFREPVATQYIKVAERCGLKEPIKEEDMKEAFRKSFKGLSQEYPNYGKNQLPSPRAWWKTVVNDTFRQVVADSKIPDNLDQAMYDHFTSSAAYELYPDVKPFLASMRELKANWPAADDPPIFLGVVTNSDPRVKTILQNLGLRVGVASIPTLESARERLSRTGPDMQEIMKSPWHDTYNSLNDIDFLASSYEAGVEKPDPGIFDLAGSLASVVYASKLEQSREDWKPSLQAMKYKIQVSRQIRTLEKATCIHIGDVFEKDYEGAILAAWEPILLARDGLPNGLEGATVVTNLAEAAAAVQISAEQQLRSSEK